jgi:metal-dependent hydrolase (beta-lactamase superfamily II)
MINTLCATLYNDDMIVTLHYGGEGDPTLHVVVDNYNYSALPPIEAERYEPVCKTKVIQVAPNFMCYLIKLDNGEFIAVDSGNNGKESYIYEQLMKHSEDGHPVIAAWFFSHFHQDHIGGFVDFAANEEYMKNVTVKRVIHNFPEQQVIKTAGGSWRDMQNVQLWQDRIARTGATQILARTGQKFRIANAEIDTIFTYQELHPFFFTVDRTNPTSSVISVRIEGQRLIITGDCCGEATRLMVRRYGEGLKTDFVQLPHHGWGDGGTAIEFYQLCDAPYVLYPGDRFAPSPSEKWACEHSKRYFLREFTTKTIPLPYDGGEYDFEK